jgi:hypothetical protein
MDQENQQNKPKNSQVTRDLNKEREELEQIIKRQPKAEQEYNRGKFLSA